MRSSSVTPFGFDTAASHAIFPLSIFIATSFPPGNPTNTPPPLTRTPAKFRTVREGIES